MKFLSKQILAMIIIILASVSITTRKTKSTRLRTKYTLADIQRIASTVNNPSNVFNCDSWMNDFTEKLKHSSFPIEYTKHRILLRPGKNRNAIVPGAQITFDGRQIGIDSHYYTIVRVDGVPFVFDNINVNGVPFEGYFDRFGFYWEGPNSDKWGDYVLQRLSFQDDVIRRRLPN